MNNQPNRRLARSVRAASLAATVTSCVLAFGAHSASAKTHRARRPERTNASGTSASGVSASGVSAPGASASGGAFGTFVFEGSDGHARRVDLRPSAKPEDLTALLDRTAGQGADRWATQSTNGVWLLLGSERFGCIDGPCLVVARADATQPERVVADNEAIRPDGFSAIDALGTTIVYPAAGGTHTRDLWVTRKGRDGWSTPQSITDTSPFAFNTQPAISPDGSRIVYSCAGAPYEPAGSTLCVVGTDGTGQRTVADPHAHGGSDANALRRGAWAPDGGIVFEGEWTNEQIWRLGSDLSTLSRVSPVGVENDNSPCVTPDGHVVSLWLNGPGNRSGQHQLRVANFASTAAFVIDLGQDIQDIGTGCGSVGVRTLA